MGDRWIVVAYLDSEFGAGGGTQRLHAHRWLPRFLLDRRSRSATFTRAGCGKSAGCGVVTRCRGRGLRVWALGDAYVVDEDVPATMCPQARIVRSSSMCHSRRLCGPGAADWLVHAFGDAANVVFETGSGGSIVSHCRASREARSIAATSAVRSSSARRSTPPSISAPKAAWVGPSRTRAVITRACTFNA